ncbi:acetyltransferase [Coccidioides immitis RS]|uniref:Acetyltransferase n=3 Tax=Coccidioides immitis TaxID=5501 RepID=A0A0E1RUK2_COCIM|nr:acetyltransferase [Coccidioides immitis RS]EAS27829.1 acetyltransferase [Coccidioides immitis RS]KMP08613.1 acetyltransferase [Coccidioides immitis RMSCC 2394]KMU78615.1 acetyltransferase [Coccidioides immitis RMSCC 3703]TPX20534.1 hypothetical protein DIZ76_016426 [Coccidioides immitis]
MSIEVRPLTLEDIPGAIECVQRAFEDDPYFRWVFDPAKFSKERNTASLRNRCLWGINNGLFYVARERVPQGNGQNGSEKSPSYRVVGVSMWLKPHVAGQSESWPSRFQDWLLSFRQLVTNVQFGGRGGLLVRRYWIYKDSQFKAEQKFLTDPQGYYHCNIVAVLPGMHGKGIGKKLVEIVTDQADKEGMGCYLESSKAEPNVKIYERMGFKVVGDLDCNDNGAQCKLFCMTRDPKPLMTNGKAE